MNTPFNPCRIVAIYDEWQQGIAVKVEDVVEQYPLHPDSIMFHSLAMCASYFPDMWATIQLPWGLCRNVVQMVAVNYVSAQNYCTSHNILLCVWPAGGPVDMSHMG